MDNKNGFVSIGVDDVFYETGATSKYLARKPYVACDPRHLNSVLPGVVQVIRVTAGQVVKRGDRLLTMEAMKMQNDLLAPRDGRIKAIHVTEGEMIPKGRLMLEYES